MTEALRSWIVGITGAAIVTAIAMTVTPDGRVKKVVTLICGLMTVIALIKPVIGFDYDGFSKYLTQYKNEAASFSSNIEQANENLSRRLIEDNCAAYILDKGQSLGLSDLSVTVRASWSEDGYWYPSGVSLITDAEETLRHALGRIIEAELGVSSEELSWSMHHEE